MLTGMVLQFDSIFLYFLSLFRCFVDKPVKCESAILNYKKPLKLDRYFCCSQNDLFRFLILHHRTLRAKNL